MLNQLVAVDDYSGFLAPNVSTNRLAFWDGDSFEDTDMTYESGSFTNVFQTQSTTKAFALGYMNGSFNRFGGHFLMYPDNYSNPPERGNAIFVNSRIGSLRQRSIVTGKH